MNRRESSEIALSYTKKEWSSLDIGLPDREADIV